MNPPGSLSLLLCLLGLGETLLSHHVNVVEMLSIVLVELTAGSDHISCLLGHLGNSVSLDIVAPEVLLALWYEGFHATVGNTIADRDVDALIVQDSVHVAKEQLTVRA